MNDEGNAEDRLEEEEPSLLGVLLLVGGVSTDADANSLATHGANIIVATPGRLEDALCSGKRLKQLNVRTLEMLILDEADRLLDLGFSTSINEILKRVPKQRRTGLFSATQTREVESLVRAGLRNPARIDVQLKLKDGAQAQLTPLSLRNRFRVVPSEQRLDELVHVLTGEPERHTIVFVLTCAMVEYLGSVLPNLAAVRQAGIQVQPLHGRMKQSRRNKEFAAFRDRCSVRLICVFSFWPPDTPGHIRRSMATGACVAGACWCARTWWRGASTSLESLVSCSSRLRRIRRTSCTESDALPGLVQTATHSSCWRRTNATSSSCFVSARCQ